MNQIFHQSAINLRQDKFDRALQQISQLQSQNPYSIDTLLNKSTISISRGQVNEGLSYLKKAIQSDPFDFRLYYNMFAVYCRTKQYYLALQNLKKCVSILYTLKITQGVPTNEMDEINRAIELWPANTASYALKAIKLINDDKIYQANEVTKQTLQSCIMKHHIFAICCLIDTRLNRQAQRDKNARDYHTHLLRPVSIPENQIPQQSDDVYKADLTNLIKQFNKVCQNCDMGQYRQYNNKKGIYFMSIRGKTSINIEYQISKGLGIIDLACIEEQNYNEGEEDLLKQDQEVKLNAKNDIKQQNIQQQIQTKSVKSRGAAKVVNWEQIQLQNQQIKTGNINTEQQIQQNLQNNFIPSQIQPNKNTQLAQNKTEQAQQNQNRSLENASVSKQIHSKQQKVESNIIKAQPPKLNKSKQQERSQSKHIKQERSKHSEDSEYLYPVTHAGFQVKLILADLQINQQLFGKMDPYVYYQYANQKHKSTIAKGQGTKPRWQNEVQKFSIEKIPTNMKVSVYDREVFKWDDLVGVGNFEVNKTGIHIIPIYMKQKKSGQVMFVISKAK